MAKAKITVEIQWELDPAYYPGCGSYQAMMELDLRENMEFLMSNEDITIIKKEIVD